jgi:capsular exopolysaccharide synthesis family protein
MEMPIRRISEDRELNKGQKPIDLISGIVILDAFTDFIRRQCLLIAIVGIAGGALGFAYLLNTRPTYTATAIVAVDGYRPSPFQAQSGASDNPDAIKDAAKAASQVAIMTMKSEVLASAVVKKLELATDQEIGGSCNGFIDRALTPVAEYVGIKTEPARSLALCTLRKFRGRLIVKMIPQAQVIEISFRSMRPDRAAQIVNTVLQRYLDDQLDVNLSVVRRTSAWLRDQVEDLRRQTSLAEQAVVDFRQSSNAEAQATLRELESTANTYRQLRDNVLRRYMETVQQETLPVAETRVISFASPPLEASGPNWVVVLTFTTIGGLVLGGAAAMLRELTDRAFRTSGQVEAMLHMDCLAVIPTFERRKVSTPMHRDPDAGAIGRRAVTRTRSSVWNVIDAPSSGFAEAIHSVKLACKPNKAIGITSSIHSEGKSTIAAAVAQLAANAGGRIILVDCDLRNARLSREICPDAKCGLLEVLSGKALVEEATWTDPKTNLVFLPTVTTTCAIDAPDILSSDLMSDLFNKLRLKYDSIIVDLPPLVPTVDVRATTNLVDCYVLVIKWGGTKVGVVEHALGNARSVQQNFLGAVLNRADTKKVARYDRHVRDCYRDNSGRPK